MSTWLIVTAACAPTLLPILLLLWLSWPFRLSRDPSALLELIFPTCSALFAMVLSAAVLVAVGRVLSGDPWGRGLRLAALAVFLLVVTNSVPLIGASIYDLQPVQRYLLIVVALYLIMVSVAAITAAPFIAFVVERGTRQEAARMAYY